MKRLDHIFRFYIEDDGWGWIQIVVLFLLGIVLLFAAGFVFGFYRHWKYVESQKEFENIGNHE